MRCASLPWLGLLFVACGGGGASTPAATVDAVALSAAPTTTIAGAEYERELAVQLELPAGARPVVVAATIDVPPGLTVLTPGARPATNLAELELGGSPRAMRVLAGDATNPQPAPLASGPLFWLRIAPTLPRTPGTHRLAIHGLEAATRDGASLPVRSAPVHIDVVVE